jgi:hypothetical protein
MPLTSPAYDLGATEQEVRERWERHHEALRWDESEVRRASEPYLRWFAAAKLNYPLELLRTPSRRISFLPLCRALRISVAFCAR